MDAAVHKQVSKELDKLKNQVKVLNISIKEEKEKFAILIMKHKEELKDKDATIISFKMKPAESNVPSFNFGGKTHTVPLIEKKNKLKKVKPSSTGKDPLECDQCGFNAPNIKKLNIHKDTTHKEYFQFDICLHLLETPAKLKGHKQSSHSTAELD